MIHIDIVTTAVTTELRRATAKHGDLRSQLEGQAVIEEEYDEFVDEVRHGTQEEATKECVQLAAMAVKWLSQYGDIATLDAMSWPEDVAGMRHVFL